MKGPGQENGAQLPPACPLEQPPWPKRPSSPRGAYPFPARDSAGQQGTSDCPRPWNHSQPCH